jgi:hypothetical protein
MPPTVYWIPEQGTHNASALFSGGTDDGCDLGRHFYRKLNDNPVTDYYVLIMVFNGME